MLGEGAVMFSSPAAGVPHAAAVCVARVCTPRDLVFSENIVFGFTLCFLLPGPNFGPNGFFVVFNMKLHRCYDLFIGYLGYQ